MQLNVSYWYKKYKKYKLTNGNIKKSLSDF